MAVIKIPAQMIVLLAILVIAEELDGNGGATAKKGSMKESCKEAPKS